MKYYSIIFFLCGCTCCSHTGLKTPESYNYTEADRIIQEQQDSLVFLWNQIADSMIVLEKQYFHNDIYCQNLIEEGGKLNKEEKVCRIVTPSLFANHTLYFVNWFSTKTGKYRFSFWEKNDKAITNSGDIYTYRYYRYKSNISNYKDEYGDSVKVYHTDEMNDYSDIFLSLCNKWDTTAIKTRKDLLSPMREDEHILVFRVIMKERNMYIIQCIPVIRNIGVGDQVGDTPYESISKQ